MFLIFEAKKAAPCKFRGTSIHSFESLFCWYWNKNHFSSILLRAGRARVVYYGDFDEIVSNNVSANVGLDVPRSRPEPHGYPEPGPRAFAGFAALFHSTVLLFPFGSIASHTCFLLTFGPVYHLHFGQVWHVHVSLKSQKTLIEVSSRAPLCSSRDVPGLRLAFRASMQCTWTLIHFLKEIPWEFDLPTSIFQNRQDVGVRHHLAI